MHIPEKYIKMAGAADDIQKDWEPQIGDWYHDKNYPGTVGIWGSSLPMDSLVWLPRQEDLQKILKGKFHGDNLKLLIECYQFGCSGAIDFLGPYAPMDLLWLAFVMHEKYGKCWNNEKNEWQLLRS